MHIADCIELFLADHDMPKSRIDAAWTTQLEQSQEGSLNTAGNAAQSGVSAGGPGSGRHKELIEQQLTGTHMVEGNKTVKGATVRELKNNLRGVVPQDQKKFMSMMDQHGFKTSWSTPSNAWVVHK